jgi:hypothetical protein
MPLFDINPDDLAILIWLLRDTINRDRIFPFPPHIRDRARAILAQLEGSALPGKQNSN